MVILILANQVTLFWSFEDIAIGLLFQLAGNRERAEDPECGQTDPRAPPSDHSVRCLREEIEAGVIFTAATLTGSEITSTRIFHNRSCVDVSLTFPKDVCLFSVPLHWDYWFRPVESVGC
jgi:hypothetical protein